MNRRFAMAGSVLALTGALLAMMMMPALGADLHQPHVGTECNGTGVWHFVHNQVPAGSSDGVLTAEFSSGVVVVSAYKVLRTVRHYEVVAGGVLLGASDNIDGGKLVLSDLDCDEDATTTTTQATTTTSKATTTTTKPTTTTTRPPKDTTTTTKPPEDTTTTTTKPYYGDV